jgi:hypothetical protein
MRLIWEYLGHDPPLNCRRTLDQYGYPSLHDTRARDDDQVLYKMTKEEADSSWNRESEPNRWGNEGWVNTSFTVRDDVSADGEPAGEYQEDGDSETDEDGSRDEDKLEEDVLNGNVLMVDQLWMWTVDTRASWAPLRRR